MTKRTCFRCDEPLKSPVTETASYVIGEDTVAKESVEVAEAIVHTAETRAAIESLRKKHYPGLRTEDIEIAVANRVDVTDRFGTPPQDAGVEPSTRAADAREKAPGLSDFDRREVVNVADAPEGTIKVERRVEQREVQKTGLVCRECVAADDTIIWGDPS